MFFTPSALISGIRRRQLVSGLDDLQPPTESGLDAPTIPSIRP